MLQNATTHNFALSICRLYEKSKREAHGNSVMHSHNRMYNNFALFDFSVAVLQ